MPLYCYPNGTEVNRLISKEMIYEQASISSKVRRLYIDSIREIRWANKLSHNTINLSESEEIKEFEIIHLYLKKTLLDEECLIVLDKAIGNPIIFEIYSNTSIKMVACYKKINLQDNKSQPHSPYYWSEKFDLNSPRSALPSAISIGNLYHQILKSLMPQELIEAEVDYESNSTQSIEYLIKKDQELKFVQRKIKQFESKIAKEKQFNLKVKMNQQLNQLKTEQNLLLNAKK